jgi:hypothetical protein
VLRRVRDAAYDRVFTTDAGPARADEWLQPRNTIRRGDDAAALDRVLESCNGAAPEIFRWVKLAVKRWR